MFLWECKPRVSWGPKISLLRFDDGGLFLEWGRQWWSDEKYGRWFLVFEVEEDLEDAMSADQEILESKAKIYSSFLSISFDVVMVIYFIWRQDVGEHDECKEWHD